MVSCCVAPDVSSREWTCPDDAADRPWIHSHNRYTKNGEGDRKKKAWRCGYCKKKLVLSRHSPDNLTSNEAMDAG